MVEEIEEEEPFTSKDIIPIVILVVLLVGIAVAAVLIIRNQKKNEAKGTTVRTMGNRYGIICMYQHRLYP